MIFRRLLVPALFAVLTSRLPAADTASPREHLSLDANWKFHLGDDWPNALRLDKAGASGGPAAEKFNDTAWRTLNLPHDWAIELPFDKNADASHGFKPVGPGFPKNSIGWYRRTFELPKADSGKRIWLHVRRRVPRRDGLGQRLARAASRRRLLSVPLRHHGHRAFRRQKRRRREGGREQVRGLVLRRRGHLPPRLAGQDRAGGHRAGRDFCLEPVQEQCAGRATQTLTVELELLNST